MNDPRDLGDTDPVTRHELRRLATHDGGPCVTIYLPTHRYRPDIGQDPTRLRRLLEEAHQRLCDLGLRSPEAWELLAPHRELLGRLDFWLHQSHGLALFAAPGFHRRYRLPFLVDEDVTVGTQFRVRPLLALPTADRQYHLLVVDPQRVRAFVGTTNAFAELPLGDVPSDLATAVALDDPERQRHARSPMGRSTPEPGHGGDDPPRDEERHRFLQMVDRGLSSVFAPDPAPLVLAGVAEDVDELERAMAHPAWVVGRVLGSPSAWGLRELHARSLAAASDALEVDRIDALRDLQELGDDRIVVDLAEIARAAEEGRVASLVVAADARGGPWAGDLLDRAIAQTLGHGGAAVAVAEIDLRQRAQIGALAAEGDLVEPAEAAAVLRY